MLPPYIKNSHFVVRTDHEALDSIFDSEESTARLARCRSRVMKFDFVQVQYRPGKKNMVADALLRLQSYRMDESYLDEDIPNCYVEYVEDIFSVDIVKSSRNDDSRKKTINDLIRKQRKDDSCRILMNRVNDSNSSY